MSNGNAQIYSFLRANTETAPAATTTFVEDAKKMEEAKKAAGAAAALDLKEKENAERLKYLVAAAIGLYLIFK